MRKIKLFLQMSLFCTLFACVLSGSFTTRNSQIYRAIGHYSQKDDRTQTYLSIAEFGTGSLMTAAVWGSGITLGGSLVLGAAIWG